MPRISWMMTMIQMIQDHGHCDDEHRLKTIKIIARRFSYAKIGRT